MRGKRVGRSSELLQQQLTFKSLRPILRKAAGLLAENRQGDEDRPGGEHFLYGNNKGAGQFLYCNHKIGATVRGSPRPSFSHQGDFMQVFAPSPAGIHFAGSVESETPLPT